MHPLWNRWELFWSDILPRTPPPCGSPHGGHTALPRRPGLHVRRDLGRYGAWGLAVGWTTPGGSLVNTSLKQTEWLTVQGAFTFWSL